jgi:D-apionolactonase
MPFNIDHIFYGGQPAKPSLKLRAGNLSMILEHGNIRYISDGRNEIIRMIYPAVRDAEWLTIVPVITYEKIERGTHSFRIEYDCIYRSGKINFAVRYTIEGLRDNLIIFSLEGEALTTFEKNRIGFCILHPIEGCSGNPCFITHSNGETEPYVFPNHISPHQPFSDIKAMKWEAGGTEFLLEFSGDIFETEDQRNWSDASYKTYSTPLSKPFPATVRKGEKISQKVIFKAAEINEVHNESDDLISVTVNPGLTNRLPAIGIGRSTRQISLTENEISILKELKFDHYRTDLYLFNANWKDIAEAALKESSALGYKLELVLFFDDNYKDQSDEFISWVILRKPEVSIITILHKTETVLPVEPADEIIRHLGKSLGGIRICCGTNANFAQLNRNRQISEKCDLVGYSIHPQEHASDITTLTENLKGQAYTVESARKFFDRQGIWVSPVNLRRRFNANVENYESTYNDTSLPPQVDTRILSLFGASWTAISIKYLSESGATGITYLETAGERGIIQGDLPSGWPIHFRSVAGMIFPVAIIIKFILKDKSFRVAKSTSSQPLKADCFVLSDGKTSKIIVVNFTSLRQTLNIKGYAGKAGLKQIHAGNYPEVITDLKWMEKSPAEIINLGENIILEPFSISFINTLHLDNQI